MKNSVKEIVMGLLVWSCIVWFCAIDFDMFEKWFKIMICLGGCTWLWWWICDFENPFKENENDEKV